MSRTLTELLCRHPVPQPDVWPPARSGQQPGQRTRYGWWKLMRLFQILVDGANEQDALRVWLSQDTLLARTGFQWKYDVQVGLQLLQDLGLITKVGKRSRADVYEVSTAWLPAEYRHQFQANVGRAYPPDIGLASPPDDTGAQSHADGHADGLTHGRADRLTDGLTHGRASQPLTEQLSHRLPNAESEKHVRRTPDGDALMLQEAARARIRELVAAGIDETRPELEARKGAR